jgi:YaiO membrane beta barrel domain
VKGAVLASALFGTALKLPRARTNGEKLRGLAFRASCAIAAVLAGVQAAPAAGSGSSEIELRDYLFTFVSPGDALGPWHTTKLDYSYRADSDAFFVRLVSGNREDRTKPQHGEFVRLEAYHRFTHRSEIKVAVGSGDGYQPLRSTTFEAVEALDPPGRVAFSVGTVLTSQNNIEFQRIFAVGPDLRIGSTSAYARYYAPVTTSPNRSGPGTLALNFSCPVTRSAAVTVYANFGGEVGGDRTASQLPTSSGRFGPDVGLAAKVGVSANLGLIATYEVASYRSASGAFAYMDHVAILGAYVPLGRR